MPSETRPRLGIIALNSAIPRLLGLVHDDAVGSQAVGGIEVQITAIARELARREWHVTLLTAPFGEDGEAGSVDGLRVLPATGGARSRSLGGLMSLARQLRRLPVDVWLMQGIHPLAGVASLLSHLSGRRFVFWLASDTDATCQDPRTSRIPRPHRPFAAYGVRSADAVIAQTSHQKQLVQDNFKRASTVIPNVWPVDSLRPGRANAPTALWVANLRWEKRPELVLEVAAAAPEVRFVMVGGPMRGNDGIYQHILAHQHDLPNFHYAGFVPFDTVGQYFESADMFINTSAVEGFPNTFLQAWDAHLPIVATFDPDGVLEREQLGYHCAGVPELVERVQLLAADGERRRELGERGKRYLRDHFSLDVVIPRLEAVLQEVGGRRS